jgi:hypothetical protein
MAKKKKDKKKNRKWIILMIAGTLAVITLMYVYGEPPPRYIPQDLVGVWRTTDSVYGDRFIEFSPATISCGTGAATISQTGFMKLVETTSEDGKTLYMLHYQVDGADAMLSFFYDGPDGEGLRLRNKKGILWTKQKDPF